MHARMHRRGATCLGAVRLLPIDVGWDVRTQRQAIHLPTDWSAIADTPRNRAADTDQVGVGYETRRGVPRLILGTRAEVTAALRRAGYLVAPESRKITISGDWREHGCSEWAGSGTVDRHGRIECAADIGDAAYDAIEAQIVEGARDGEVTIHDDEQDRDITYRWSMD